MDRGRGDACTVRPEVGDRLETSPVAETAWELTGLGRLRCRPATELEVIDVRWRTVGAGVVTFAVVAGGVWWFANGDEGGVEVPAGQEVRAGESGRPPLEARSSQVPVREPDAAAGEPQRAAIPPPVPPAPLARVHGVCAGPDGRPLAGGRVALAARVRPGANEDVVARVRAWKRLPTVTAGADGAFEFRFEPPAGFAWEVACSGGDLAPVACDVEAIEPGADVDLGVIELPAGTRVQGSVVDEEGAPVANVLVRFEAVAESARVDRRPHPVDLAVRRSDASGRFTTAPIVPGSQRVRLEDDRAFTLVSPNAFWVEPDAGVQTLRVVVRRRDVAETIAGVVVDEAGVPAAGVRLLERGSALSPFSGSSAVSHDDGRFELVRRRTAEDTVLLGVAPYDVRFSLAGEAVPARWGARDVRIVVRRPVRVAVLVVEAGSGAPVTDYGVRCLPQDKSVFSSSMAAIRGRGKHADGRFVLEDVGRGLRELYVFPGDPDLAASEAVPFEATDTAGEVRVELARRTQRLRLRVTTPEGLSCAEVRARLLRWEGSSGRRNLATLVGTPEEAFVDFVTSGPRGIVVDEGRTDSDGRVELRAPRRKGGYALLLPGPGHLPVLHDAVDLSSPTTDLTLQIAKGCSLRGRLGPEPALAELRAYSEANGRGLFVALAGAAGSFPSGIGWEVDAQGGFIGDGILPGTWRVVLKSAGPLARLAATSLGDPFTLEAGATAELTFDVRAALPGTLRGQVFLDGEAYANRPIRAPGSSEVLAHTNAGGRFTLAAPPGPLRLGILPHHVEANGAAQGDGIALEPIEITAGATIEHTFTVAHRTLTLRVLAADGTPARGRRIRVSSRDPELQLDADGCARLDPAPSGTFAVLLLGEGTDEQTTAQGNGPAAAAAKRVVLLGTDLRVPEGGRDATLELRIPVGR